MSSDTWTPEELLSEAHSRSGECWRIVEAQHAVSTAKITDTLEEQSLIERIVEETKPIIPAECRHLNFLLFTPFRYLPAARGSRFRRAASFNGVFYAAEEVETSVAEMAFYRLLFFAESPSTPWPSNPAPYTAFAVTFDTQRGLDLTRPSLNRFHKDWTALVDYEECQRLAGVARENGIDVIRYQSVRDPDQRANIALLRCRAFTRPNETRRQTWHLHTDASGVRALCEAPAKTIAFEPDAFADDPRMAGFIWTR